MRFSVLGPLEVEGSSGPVAVSGRRLRTLLAALVLNHSRPVSADTLIDAVWGPTAPRDALSSLRNHAMRLRRLLGADVIQTVGDGYQLVVEDPSSSIDASLFLSDRYSAGAALGLWRGRPYFELEGWVSAEPEIVRLVERREELVDRHYRELLERGRHLDALADLRRAVAEQPFREGRWALLALGYYRAGRQADALAALHELRMLLRDEVGVDPGSAVTELESAILRQDVNLLHPHTRPRARPTSSSPFVGRDGELKVLLKLWTSVRHRGHAATALVVAEPGLGKTRLMAEFAATNADVLTLATRCDEDEAVAFQPVITLLRRLVDMGHEPPTNLRPALAVLLPELTPPAHAARESHLPDGRARLFNAVCVWLRTVATEPMLLTIDDLHWATSSTLSLLRALIAAVADRPAMIVAASRSPVKVAESTPMVGGVDATINLSPLPDEAVATFLTAVLPHGLASRRAEVVRHCGGNPFLMVNSLQNLAATGLIGLTENARTVLVHLANQSGASASHVLAHDAVLGDEIAIGLSARVHERSVADLVQTYDASVQLGLLVETGIGKWRFRHSLVRDAFASLLSPSRAALVHVNAAQAIAELRPSAALEIANHLLAAGTLAPLDGQTCDRFIAAGDDAAETFAFVEAAGWFERAINVAAAAHLAQRLPALRTRCAEMLAASGDTQWRDVAADAIVGALAASDIDIAIRAVRIGTTHATVDGTRWIDIRRLELVQRVLVEIPPGRPGDRAIVSSILGDALVNGPRYLDGRALTGAAVELSRVARLPDEEHAIVLARHASAVIGPGGVATRAAIADELAAIAERAHVTQATRLRFYAGFVGAQAYLEAGDRARAEQCRAWLHATATEPHLGHPRWGALLVDFNFAFIAGQLSEAARLAADVVDAAASAGYPDARNFKLLSLQIAIERGQAALARELFDDVEWDRTEPVIRLLDVITAAMSGKISDTATALLDEIAADDFAGIRRDRLFFATVSATAGLALALGHRAVGTSIQRVLASWSGHLDFTGTIGPSPDQAAGDAELLLGDHDCALHRYELARITAEKVGASLYAHRAIAGHALALALRPTSTPAELTRAATGADEVRRYGERIGSQVLVGRSRAIASVLASRGVVA